VQGGTGQNSKVMEGGGGMRGATGAVAWGSEKGGRISSHHRS